VHEKQRLNLLDIEQFVMWYIKGMKKTVEGCRGKDKLILDQLDMEVSDQTLTDFTSEMQHPLNWKPSKI
jgi:hypothetical protein